MCLNCGPHDDTPDPTGPLVEAEVEAWLDVDQSLSLLYDWRPVAVEIIEDPEPTTTP